MIEIVLAGRPMGKERVKRGAAGNAYTPERTVRFEDRFSIAAQTAMGGRPLFEGALQVDIMVVLPIPPSKSKTFHRSAIAGTVMATVKPDWDNLAKCVDALNLVVWRDDAQIIHGQVLKIYGIKPLMAVRVTPLARQPAPPAWVQKHLVDTELFG